MLEIILSSFLLVAAGEMGDKTQLLAFTLAARFKKPWAIMAGILVATLFNHGLASFFGEWISNQISPRTMAFLLAAAFVSFGIWTLKPDSINITSKKSKFGPFVTTLSLFFIAEMGDKTQVATIALAAKYQSVALVTLGTTLGMLISDGLAVFLGKKMGDRVQTKWIRWFAATLFFIFGLLSFGKAL